MCLLVVRFGEGDDPLVLGANRDERYDRPAVPMTRLRDEPRTIGGRDEQAGGTWLAVNEHGVVAGLTNQPMPDGPDPTKPSRGELPLAFTAHRTAAEAAEAYRPGGHNPAWLLVGDRTSLFVVDTAAETVDELPPGTHILENRAYGLPSARVDQVRAVLEADGLEAALADPRIPDEPEVEEQFRPYRAPCVHTPDYGTRWSAIITVPADGLPRFRYADGPSCTTPFVDAGYFWGRRSE